jgi:predicted nucleotidyltransferase
MIKYTKLPATIETLIPRAVNYLKLHPRVVFAYLFGGLARGKLQPLSDVDIAVYLKEDARIAENKLDILGCLIDILETDEIDLVILNTADLPLVMNIVKNRKIIADKDPFARHIFESLAMRKYFDFSIKEAAILRRRYLHG